MNEYKVKSTKGSEITLKKKQGLKESVQLCQSMPVNQSLHF